MKLELGFNIHLVSLLNALQKKQEKSYLLQHPDQL
jgi:hypothetical protein